MLERPLHCVEKPREAEVCKEQQLTSWMMRAELDDLETPRVEADVYSSRSWVR
jgi:hypothetical protein